MDSHPLSIAFTLGLFSTLHCLGMCGGIIGALTLSLPPEVRAARWRLVSYVGAYNIGRILSYTLAGAVFGAFGQRLFQALSPTYGHLLLQGLAALVLVSIGLYLAGWFPRFTGIEALGAPLWRRLEPLGQRLLPVRSPAYALLFGTIWGWLPCGLVYSALLWTTTTGGAVTGALTMLAFGAGTLPGVMSAGVFTGWLTRVTRLPYVRQGVGLTLIVLAVVSLWLAAQAPADHSAHLLHHHGTMPGMAP